MLKAFEAKALSLINTKKKNDPLRDYQPLIKTIEERIHTAASNGQSSTTLGSILPDGSLVRGIGTYLSQELIDSISFYLIENGYTVTVKPDKDIKQTIVTISW